MNEIIIPRSIVTIGNHAFVGCSALTIYAEIESMPNDYSSEWNSSNCPVFFYSKTPKENYWHYVGNIPTIWQETQVMTGFGYLGLIYKWGGAVDMFITNPACYFFNTTTDSHTFTGNTNVTFKIRTASFFNLFSIISGSNSIILKNSANQVVQIAGKNSFDCTVKVTLSNDIIFGGDGDNFSINTADLSNGTYTLTLTSIFTRSSYTETHTSNFTFVVSK